jgi:hypothetical protein
VARYRKPVELRPAPAGADTEHALCVTRVLNQGKYLSIEGGGNFAAREGELQMAPFAAAESLCPCASVRVISP